MTEPPLHHETLPPAPRTPPTRRIAMLHGSFGSGRNLAGFAGHLLAARPDYAATLIDLPGHGRSTHPHHQPSLAAAAHQVLRFAAPPHQPFDALLGHSLGGKVALHTLAPHHHSDTPAPTPRQLWIIDSTPAPLPHRGEARRMLDLIRSLPASFDHRAQAVAALQAAGIPAPTAQWMAMNLDRPDGASSLRWRFDPDFMQQLLDDFHNSDGWHLVEHPPPDTHIHFVKAAGSDLLTPAALDRIAAAGRDTHRVHLHTLPGGHWLHVDSPEPLAQLLADHLP